LEFIPVTGLSGSGKSTLAFDTLYAEGQRRYVESLSAYARQFLEQMERANVESIEGLSPAIAIDQWGMSRNPRSTVGTVTEVYDYLRLLLARVGEAFCPQCGSPSQAPAFRAGKGYSGSTPAYRQALNLAWYRAVRLTRAEVKPSIYTGESRG